MSELQLSVVLNEGSISVNSDELKKQLKEVLSEYEGAVFTEESKQIAKGELAKLRKLRESIDTRRKEIKSNYLIPYNEFEKEVKELIVIVDRPITLIDKQLKEMEAERIRKKKLQIQELYTENIGQFAEYLPLERIYDKKWENATMTLPKIKEAMEALADKTMREIEILQNSTSDVKDEALKVYRQSNDLSRALTHINTYEANKKRAMEIEEARRMREEERRREQEIERAKAEERRRLEEIEAAKRGAERQKEEELRRLQQMTREVVQVSVQEEESGGFVVDAVDSELPFEQPDTRTVFYRIVASEEEIEEVEKVFNSFGIYFERRDS